MKKFFMFAAMASVALASCVKNEPVATVEQGDLITFNSPVVGLPTKATELTDATYPDNLPFNVYAWYSEDEFYQTGTKYMNNVTVEHTAKTANTDGTNCYAPTTDYYWPKSGFLSFIAYSPSVASGLSAKDMTGDGEMVLYYTVPTEPANQVDLMYSDWACDKTTSVGANGGYQGVDLAFNHALSVVKFYFKGATATEAANIQITDITLEDVLSTGTLTCTWVDSETPNAEWLVDEETTADYQLLVKGDSPYAYQLTANETTIGTEAGNINNLILLPQTLSNDAVVKVSYNIKSPATSEWIEQTPVSLKLNAAKVGENALTEWNMKTIYKYTIVFDLDNIYFAPAVKTDWITVEANLNQTL